jgi:hypothetical protein
VSIEFRHSYGEVKAWQREDRHCVYLNENASPDIFFRLILGGIVSEL